MGSVAVATPILLIRLAPPSDGGAKLPFAKLTQIMPNLQMIAILLESFDGFAQLLKTRRVAFDARRTSLAPKRAATRKLDVGHNHRIKVMLSKLGILALIHLLP